MLEIIILAAGMGKRMRSALPKVLHQVGGQPMLAHVLDTARLLEPGRIHVVYGHGGEQVRASFLDPKLNWVEQPELLGTGDAVKRVMPHLEDSSQVLVLYGDVPLLRPATLRNLLAAAEFSVLTAELGDPSGYGRVVTDSEARVLAIVEQKDATPEARRIRRINSGILSVPAASLKRWLLELRPNNAQGEYYLTDIFALAARENVPAIAIDCVDLSEISGANDARQLAALSRAWYARQAEDLLDRGVRLAAPETLFNRARIEAAQDVEIDVNVVLEGVIRLGEGVRIGAFSVIKDCDLAAGTEVLSHCHLDGVRTTGACRIGPYARLRPGTELAEGSHVGNFVETKKAKLGRNSKANHLSYLGDATVGENVNIGAGTITCNYDGVNKFATHIEDGVFVGSNSSLVAPLTIGAGATIGAGSVVAKNAPSGELTIARARQVSIKQWRPKAK